MIRIKSDVTLSLAPGFAVDGGFGILVRLLLLLQRLAERDVGGIAGVARVLEVVHRRGDFRLGLQRIVELLLQIADVLVGVG